MIMGWFKYFLDVRHFADLFTFYGGGKGGGGGSAPAPDPNIGIAQRELSQISREYLESWKTEIWPEMKRVTEKQEERADEQFDLDTEMQRTQMGIAKEQYQRYLSKYMPMQDSIINEANAYDTEANRERMAAEAIGDTKNAFAIKAADDARKMESYGINPTSGQFSGMRNANSVLEAATAASAATRTREAAKQLGWAKKMDAIALGSGVFGNQATSTGLALNAGNQALGAGQLAMANYGQMGSSMNQANMGAMSGWGQVGQLGVQKYNADVNAYAAQQQAQATQNAGMSAGIGSAIGGLGAMAAKYGPALAAASDIRTKENITVVGTLPNGLTIYEFEYKPEFKDKKYYGKGRHRGLMAHEVEKVIPEAVFEMDDGYKAIDYSKVN